MFKRIGITGAKKNHSIRIALQEVIMEKTNDMITVSVRLMFLLTTVLAVGSWQLSEKYFVIPCCDSLMANAIGW